MKFVRVSKATANLLLIGVASLCAAGQAASTVTYRSDGKHLDAVLKEISASAGTALKCSTFLAKDIVAVRVSGASLDELKAELAKIEHAEWRSKDGFLELGESADSIRKDDEFHNHAVVAAFGDAMRIQSEALQKQGPFDAAGASVYLKRVQVAMDQVNDPRAYALSLRALEPLSPTHRAAVRILDAFRPESLAALPLRIKTTFSNLPTSTERRLPDAATTALNQFIKEQAAWSTVVAEHPLPPLARNGTSMALPPFVGNRRAPVGTVVKALASFFRESELGRTIVEFKLASEDGAIIAQGSATISAAEHEATSPELPTGGTIHPVVATPEALPLTPLASGPITSATVRDALLNPEITDPLAIAYGSTLAHASEDEGVNFVAILSDRLWDGGLRQSRFESTQQYLKALARKGQRSELSGGWLELAPEDLAWDRRDRADRAALGGFLRSSVAGNFSIEDQAACALKLPDPMENMMPAVVLGRLQNQMAGLRDVALLRFYGSLSGDERQRAQEADGLRLVEIASPSAMGYLDEIVFARTNPLVIPRNTHSEIWREPSECLGSGLDSASVLHLSVKSVSSIFDLDQDKSPFQMSSGAVSAGEVAFAQFERSHPERFPSHGASRSEASSSHFQLGELKTYDFAFRYLSDVTSNGTLACRTLTPGSALSLDELPESFLTEVAKSLEMIERDEARFHAGGQTSKPVGRATP